MGESRPGVIMTAGIVLQTAGERLRDNFFEAILYPFVQAFGGVEILALLVFGGIGMAYYQVQRSVIIPVIMLILIGSATLSRAPSSAGNAIIALATLALASIGYILYTRARER